MLPLSEDIIENLSFSSRVDSTTGSGPCCLPSTSSLSQVALTVKFWCSPVKFQNEFPADKLLECIALHTIVKGFPMTPVLCPTLSKALSLADSFSQPFGVLPVFVYLPLLECMTPIILICLEGRMVLLALLRRTHRSTCRGLDYDDRRTITQRQSRKHLRRS